MTGLRVLAFFLMLGVLAGCAELRVPSDRTALAEKMAEDRARQDMACPSAKADRPIRRDSMDNWTNHLFSEYNAWVEGCDRQVNYIVVCEIDDQCYFADLPEASYPARTEDFKVSPVANPKP